MLKELDTTSSSVLQVAQPIAHVLFTLVLGLCLIGIFKSSNRIFFKSLSEKSRLASYKKRLDTLRILLDNVVTFGIFILTILMILSDIGFDITPILASAGLVGLALSFGAQTLVRDFLSGFFLITENQYNVGDTIEANDTKGEVVKINLRTTVIRDKKGNKTFLPNSKIEKVKVFKNIPQKDVQ